MPTIPSPRDGPPSSARSSSSKAFTRSPGRTYSMSRLDQLSQPRKRPTELSTLTEQQQAQPLGASSMSRSMCHLAASGAKILKHSDNSRSMGQLPGSVPVPRPTRAERLRRKAREYQNHQQPGMIVKVHSTPEGGIILFFIFFNHFNIQISQKSTSSCFGNSRIVIYIRMRECFLKIFRFGFLLNRILQTREILFQFLTVGISINLFKRFLIKIFVHLKILIIFNSNYLMQFNTINTNKSII